MDASAPISYANGTQGHCFLVSTIRLSWHHVFCACSSDDPNKDVQALLSGYEKEPESEAQLKMLLPHIVSSFGSHRSVFEAIEELKKHQFSTDAVGMFLFWLLKKGYWVWSLTSANNADSLTAVAQFTSVRCFIFSPCENIYRHGDWWRWYKELNVNCVLTPHLFCYIIQLTSGKSLKSSFSFIL